MDISSILRKIEALLRMAEDKSSPEEAATAARQAQKMMEKYQVDHKMLVEKELRDNNDEDFSYWDAHSATDQTRRNVKTPAPWAGVLGLAIAQLNEVRAKFVKDQYWGRMVRFEGYLPDVQVSKFTWRYIVYHMLRYKENADFNYGFISAVSEQLRQARRERDEERAAAQAKGEGNAIVVLKADALTARYGPQTTSQARGRSSADASRGYAEGQKFNALMRGVEGKSGGDAKRLK